MPYTHEILGKEVERAAGVEPATSSLGSWHSTTELRPLSELKLSRTRLKISTTLKISTARAARDMRRCAAAMRRSAVAFQP
jgi:hypothetical protein